MTRDLDSFVIQYATAGIVYLMVWHYEIYTMLGRMPLNFFQDFKAVKELKRIRKEAEKAKEMKEAEKAKEMRVAKAKEMKEAEKAKEMRVAKGIPSSRNWLSNCMKETQKNWR